MQKVDLHFKTDSEDRLGTKISTKEITSNFTLWRFHLYVAIFQQHLHMDYMSLSWSDIPQLVDPIVNSLIEVSYWLSWSHLFKSFMVVTMNWLQNMSVTNDNGYFPFIVVIIRPFPNPRVLVGFVFLDF
jgi:hypothetical protein